MATNPRQENAESVAAAEHERLMIELTHAQERNVYIDRVIDKALRYLEQRDGFEPIWYQRDGKGHIDGHILVYLREARRASAALDKRLDEVLDAEEQNDGSSGN